MTRRPPLHKRQLFDHNGYKVCAVDSLAVRDISLNDEEFGNFAVHDEFPRLIPEDEIWLINGDRLSGVIEQEAVEFQPDGGDPRRIPRERIHTLMIGQGVDLKAPPLG